MKRFDKWLDKLLALVILMILLVTLFDAITSDATGHDIKQAWDKRYPANSEVLR